MSLEKSKTSNYRTDPDGAEMSAEISVFAGDGYRIRISNIVPDEALDGRWITIRTNAKGMEEITVPISLLR